VETYLKSSEHGYGEAGIVDPDKVEEAEDIISDFDMEEPYWIKPYTDFDGPVRTRSSGEETYHDGVSEAFNSLIQNEEILNPGIISGRGIGYLLKQVEELDLSEVDVAGEMGATYLLQGEFEGGIPDAYDAEYVIPENEESMEDIYAFNLNLFEHLADHDLQLLYGDNMSNVTGSACIEAFGPNLDEDRFSIEDTVYADIYDHSSAQAVQRQINGYMDGEHADIFEFHNDMIRFPKTEEAAEVLTHVFMTNPFIPWGFHDEGDRMAIFPQYRADPDFTQEDFEAFVDSVTQDFNRDADTEFWTSTYHDHSFDFGKEGYENLKTRAAETMVEEKKLDEPVVMTNTGDKPTDILETENSVFFAQEGTPAHRYAENNDVPHVVVEDAAEAFRIQEVLASRHDSPDYDLEDL
jgi:hypothetical protein